MTPAAADHRRWRGQPGFFEIWFAVVLEPALRRAWWLRYTTFAPRVGPRRATVWAAAFDADHPPVAGKRIVPLAPGSMPAWADGPFAGGACRGEVHAGGTTIAWDVQLAPNDVTHAGPRWLAHVPAPTRVAHARSEVGVRGWVRVGGRHHELSRAIGLTKHIWGTRRVEELYWLYCPRLDGGGHLEATQARLRRQRGPRLGTLHLATGDECWDGPVLRTHVEPAGAGRLRLRATGSRWRITGEARCDPSTLVGWVYRDPAGWDVHVAQSDVATAAFLLSTRRHRLAPWERMRRLTATQAAIEFHHPDPLPGVDYLGWDETHREEPSP